MEVDGELHAFAKGPVTNYTGDWVGPRVGIDTYGKCIPH